MELCACKRAMKNQFDHTRTALFHAAEAMLPASIYMYEIAFSYLTSAQVGCVVWMDGCAAADVTWVAQSWHKNSTTTLFDKL